MSYTLPIQLRWSDVDQNRHLRHSAYYDFGALMRMRILTEKGLTTAMLEQLQVGPVLFREEAVFRREVALEDSISLDIALLKATRDFSRWTIRHNMLKGDGTLAAVLTVDGAWIDLTRRKLAVPNEFIRSIFDQFPRPEEFQWTEPAEKKN